MNVIHAVKLSEKVLRRQKAEEPKWLMKLRQLLPDNTEHCSPSEEQKESSSKSEQHLVFHPSVHNSTLESVRQINE
ncbi:hypothetical protein KOW79_019828 [Hemibagrus wyckioides]|uniref:Uncharacterized protein n=1 Tax=Hemibagrus wyckioides TaxID=337641 RepID=A0A9D3N5V9_9TELE|nr:hypothetical protein KOW79_019828 [Hemibagrus wyckioides]